ncbi:hypothetical protein A464_1809 [Salmonella bongori N268-08]|uniref:Uncharacterized protein n=1 Tax=Salmonella bongori N268-08 TaxID=1197719 RepID=S5MWL8_SALBN|nr:hypothetical protein A464_1809 [Salmonella bongori N268-08]
MINHFNNVAKLLQFHKYITQISASRSSFIGILRRAANTI